MNKSLKTPCFMSEAPPEVAIILVNWNGCADTLECLESIFRLDYPNFRVLVCDNASSDNSPAAITEWARAPGTVVPQSPYFRDMFLSTLNKKNIRFSRYTFAEAGDPATQMGDSNLVLVEVGANLGFAGGNNVGILCALEKTSAKYVWLLNTDTVVKPDALSHLIERAMLDDRIGMVGSSLVYYWEPGKVQGMGGSKMNIRTTRSEHIGVNQPIESIPFDPAVVEAEMAYVIGASMLVSRAFIDTVGPMCEDYFLYYEELDWAFRGREKFKLAYAPTSIVFHKVGGSSKRVESMTSLRFLHQNRLRFVARFLPERYIATMLSLTGDMLRSAIKGDFASCSAICEALFQSRYHYMKNRQLRIFSKPKI